MGNSLSRRDSRRRRPVVDAAAAVAAAAASAGAGEPSNEDDESLPRSVKFFDEQTNKGIVLSLDISKLRDLGLVLTKAEEVERTSWATLRGQLEQSEVLMGRSIVRTQEQLLQRRVAAPVLNPQSEKASTRSRPAEGRTDCMYAHRVDVWNEFPGLVSATKPTGNVTPLKKFPFILGLDDGECLSDERSEERYLIHYALGPLSRIGGLLQKRTDGSKGCKGAPDFFFCDDDNDTPVLIGESKSTHNLPLPMEAREICTEYNAALASMMMPETEERTPAWSQIGHPIAQLSGYMVLNNCRYGVLTSGTRSYFLMVKEVQNEEILHISDAWFVGQADYLRAWVCAHNLGVISREARVQVHPKLWSNGTPDLQKRKRDREDRSRSQDSRKGARKTPRTAGDRNSGGMKSVSPGFLPSIGLATSIPEIDYNEIEFLYPIGYGRRGTAFAAKWKNETVALKQFDTWKQDGYKAFKSEIAAYEQLKNAWGKLVPEPKFIAEAYGVIFFGLQMAEHPPDTAKSRDWDEVVDELENVYGFRHADLEGDCRSGGLHNRMVIRGPDNKIRPIVVDLEDYDLV